MSDTKVRMKFIIEHGLGQRWSQSPGYNKWKPGDENLDWIQYQVGSKTNKSLKWDFTGCSERRTESKTIVRLMEVWIRIKPEEETKMLLQNTKNNSSLSSDALRIDLELPDDNVLSCNDNFWMFCLNSKDEIDEIRKKKYLCHGPAEINYFQFGYFSANVTNTLKTILKDKVVGVVLHSLSVCYHRGGVDSVCHRVQLMT